MSELVQVPTTDGEMPAHLWLPESGRGPGVLLLQEIFGVSDYILRRGHDLADLGYVVLAPELYWRLGVAQVENGPSALDEGVALMQRLDWDTTVADSVAALDSLRARAEVGGGVGVFGFCFGGGVAFNVAAVSDPDVLVSYYGSAVPGLLALAPDVRATSLHHFGLADGYIDAATVEEVRRAVAAPHVTVETHEGADHAFDNPDFVLYDERASTDAWATTTRFLAEHLPTR